MGNDHSVTKKSQTKDDFPPPPEDGKTSSSSDDQSTSSDDEGPPRLLVVMAPIYEEVITLPASCFPPHIDLIVFDKGCSMTKVMVGERDGATVQFLCRTVKGSNMEPALDWLRSTADINETTTVRVTGIGGDSARNKIWERLKCGIEFVDEFWSLKKGAELLIRYGDPEEIFYPDPEVLYEAKLLEADIWRKAATRSFDDSPYPTLYIDIGSASGATWISEDDVTPLTSGCLLGGKTFLGLANLLLDTTNWEEINTLALEGNRENIDLTGHDVFSECQDASYKAFPKEMSIFLFGKLADSLEKKEKVTREDIAAALIGLFVEIFCTYAHALMKEYKGNRIVLGGNFTRSEYFRRDCFTRHQASALIHGGKTMKFIRTGHTAAFGALLVEPNSE